MKALLCAVAFVFLANYCFGQKVPQIYQIRADTVRIYNTCDTAEFVLENRTKDTLGFLFNKGKGRTEFRRLGLERIGASQLAIKGQDTIDLNFSSYGDTRYDLLSTNFRTIAQGDSLLFGQWPSMKVIGYDAYNSPDMPVLSNQAIQAPGSKLYYNGLVVRDGDSGFDFAVNWNGELNGPNGAFLRTKDDTKTAWSKWRELLFKDYADTAYAPKNSETLQSVMARGNSTSQSILFGGTSASSPGLSWNYNTDVWRIFVESPQDTPAGDMIFESTDNQQEGWVFRTNNPSGTAPNPILNIQPEGTFTYKGNNILHTGNHEAGSGFATTGLTGAAVFSTIATNESGHLTQLATRQLTAADIGAAPATASGNYVQNQTSADQPSSGFRITGTGRSNSQFQIVKDGSNSVASAFQLYNAASTRGANIQLDANTNPGLNFWVHDGTTWQNRLLLKADGNVGIGTASPVLGVHIKNSTGGLILEANKPFATTSGGLFEAYNSGTPSAANQRLGGITMGALTNGTELRPSSQIDVLTAAAWSNDTSQSSYMRFITTAIGSKQPAERMRIGADGTITMFNIPALGTAGTNFLTSNGGVISSRTAAQLLADIGAAPATTSGNYVQNLSTATGTQTANFSINGTGYAATALSSPLISSNSSAGQLSLVGGATATGSARGGEIDLLAGGFATTPGEILFRTGTGTGGTQQPERMRIDATGNVGIGTSDPVSPLHVVGAATVTSMNGSGTATLQISSGGSAQATALMGGATSAQSNQGGAITLFGGAHASQPGMIAFYTGTAIGGTQQPERMRITATGNLGIGTNAPAYKLDVYTNSDTYAASFGDAANSNLKITGTAGGATGYGLIQTFTGGTTTGGTLSLQRSGGNVGIGLTAPTGRLEIANGTTAELQFSGANVANIYQSTSAQALYVNSNTGPLYLGANGSGSTHLTVLSNGNVGINNTAPAQKLEVAGGNIRAHGGNVQCGPTDASVLSALTYTTGMGVVGSFTNSPFAIYTNSAEKLRVDATGNVGIGVSAPTSKLHVAGAGLFTGQVQATSFFQSSLRSLKKDIQPFTASALDIFKKVQVRTFKFKADTSGKTNIGFIADEVPNEMATPQRNGVDQASTVALLVKAVQELTEQNKVLQEKISKLEAKMNEK